MLKTLDTVNVMEIADTFHMSVSQIVSFPDTKEGNKDAEVLFSMIIKENDPTVTDKEMQEYIDDGYFCYNDGYSWVGIIHSNPIADD